MPQLHPKGSSSFNPITEDDDLAFKSPKKPTPPGEWTAPKHWNISSNSTTSLPTTRKVAVPPISQPASRGTDTQDNVAASTPVLKNIANAPQAKGKEKCPECPKLLTPMYLRSTHLKREHSWSDERVRMFRQGKQAKSGQENRPAKRVKRTTSAVESVEQEKVLSIDDFQWTCGELAIIEAAEGPVVLSLPHPTALAEDSNEGTGVDFRQNQPSEAAVTPLEPDHHS
ncbi:hypothetical protein DXG03_000729 [Asterophora parasitica]|uniref:C2H2-type domain-containing protein n=1 Tax=Asterophora parasitica TaxID=117018 RepID=A0A9P7FZI2_9AGAR|nr:hypothetical protein DXG03_000729 [Asterophora parasitica]